VLDALARGTGRPLALRLRNERLDQVPHLAECLAALVLSAAMLLGWLDRQEP